MDSHAGERSLHIIDSYRLALGAERWRTATVSAKCCIHRRHCLPGRLADSSGTPLTSTLNMSFRLYSASSGGAPLWTEQWTGSNGVKVSDGLFNVMLGSLTPIPQSVISGNINLFLGITVGTDSEMSPRVQLGSVPFAVQALSVPDGSITRKKMDFPVGELLAEKTVEETVEPIENIATSGWHPIRGTSNQDNIEVTVTTSGGPLMAHMTARYGRESPGDMWCGIYVYQNGQQVRRALLDGSEPTPESKAIGCAGSYTFTGLPAGTYTFRAMAFVRPPTSIQWQRQRQIVVIEY
jgi:hypothetical protein